MLYREDLKLYQGFYRIPGSKVHWWGKAGGGWVFQGWTPELAGPKLDPEQYDVLIAVKPKGEQDGKTPEVSEKSTTVPN